jgi:hypothetical protein
VGVDRYVAAVVRMESKSLAAKKGSRTRRRANGNCVTREHQERARKEVCGGPCTYPLVLVEGADGVAVKKPDRARPAHLLLAYCSCLVGPHPYPVDVFDAESADLAPWKQKTTFLGVAWQPG